jgi:RNA-directed DNA polymerase
MKSTNDLIIGSIKEDKVKWLFNRTLLNEDYGNNNQINHRNLQDWLIKIHILSKEFPNSGQVYTEIKLIYFWLGSQNINDIIKQDNQFVIISLMVNIALANPKVVPLLTSILSDILNSLSISNDREILLQKIVNKFQQIPNTELIQIWIQRLILGFKIETINLTSSLLINKVKDSKIDLWKNDWLKPKYQKIMKHYDVVNKSDLQIVAPTFTNYENEKLEDDKSFY